jgi:2-oxoglutarate dehydrogenase complex dehydrogenase (E1) component-like enzyme
MAPDSEDRETARAIGKLEGLIAGLKDNFAVHSSSVTETLNHFATAWGEKDRQATEGRRALHRKMDETRTESAETRAEVTRLVERIEGLQGLPAKVDALEKQVAPFIETVRRIEPIVNKIDRTYTQGTGVAFLIKAAWMAAAGAIGALLVKYGPG